MRSTVSEASTEKAVDGLVAASEAATKTDIAKLETKVETKMEGVAMKADIAKLETNIAELETRMLRWNIIIAGVIIVAVGLIVKL